MTVSLDAFREMASSDHGLVVVSMLRGDGTIVASVVNAGVMANPGKNSDDDVVAFVARGIRKLEHLRANPHVTVVARSGWRWAAVEGTATLIGPDDPHVGVDDEVLRKLLRDVFTAAGGTHDNWDEYDRVMRDERSAAVFVTPTRAYPSG
ncbi:MAG TPA: TIGR03618 family F420-dependent PPOX class oxidoreductase [Mycobacteriales bacterium]|nr:TIGR03618 family F420-dependent PPOX class oxidoreductase [Mycobacteriales bacterium]